MAGGGTELHNEAFHNRYYISILYGWSNEDEMNGACRKHG